MKLANLTAKVKGMKFNAVKVLAAATLAGGLLVAAAPAAQAQRFVVEYRGGHRAFYGRDRVVVAPPVVEYGDPYYAQPVYEGSYGVGFYGRGGWDRDRDWDRRRDFDRDRDGDRRRDFDRDRDRGFDRDHDRGGWGRDRR